MWTWVKRNKSRIETVYELLRNVKGKEEGIELEMKNS
jgi:hypothetical protein